MQKIMSIVALWVSLGTTQAVYADVQHPSNTSAPVSQATTSNKAASTADQVLTSESAMFTTSASNENTLSQEPMLNDEEMD